MDLRYERAFTLAVPEPFDFALTVVRALSIPYVLILACVIVS